MEQKKQLTVTSIRRTAGAIGDGGQRRPGNLLINGLWFSSRELRNCLIGAGLEANIPVLALKGAKITYKEITITPEDLVANPDGVKMQIQGRDVVFKKPGTNQVEMDIDFTSVNVTENLINLAKLSTMYQGYSRAPQTTQAPAATPVKEETLEDAGNSGAASESLDENAQQGDGVQQGAGAHVDLHE